MSIVRVIVFLLSSGVLASTLSQELPTASPPASNETRNATTTKMFKLPWGNLTSTQFVHLGTEPPYPTWAWNKTQAVLQGTSSTHTVNPTSTVTVGKAGELVFSPTSLDAPAGAVIAFDFLGLNHTLTESTLQHPCKSNGGFDSGFQQFNPSNTSGRFVVKYKVPDDQPKWFFCAQMARRSHCKAGMVFSLNPGGAYDAFLRNALAAVLPSPTPTAACTMYASNPRSHRQRDYSIIAYEHGDSEPNSKLHHHISRYQCSTRQVLAKYAASCDLLSGRTIDRNLGRQSQ